MDMTKFTYVDSTGQPHKISEHGKTWVSDEWLANMGWTRVADDYQAPVSESVLLANAKTAKETIIKTLLAETDYKALKYSADKALTDAEYANTRTYREALRTAYNAVEAATTVAEVDAVTIPTESTTTSA